MSEILPSKTASGPTPLCPLCGSRDHEKRFSERGFILLVCRECDLLFIDPFPSTSDQVHDKVTDYDYEQIRILDPSRKYRSEVQFYKKYFPLIAQECEDAGSILDVGCGAGHLLEKLGAFPGLRRAGIELNTARAEWARRMAGCEIHQMPIEQFRSSAPFDVITMINVLSHIPSFDSLFASVRSLLTKNGKLILKVGEMARDVRRSDLTDWGLPDHLHFLGLNTLSCICRKYGFRILKHERYPMSADLFSRDRWRAPGRSGLRNAVKQAVTYLPLALPMLARVYDQKTGRRILSSFVVLSPEP